MPEVSVADILTSCVALAARSRRWLRPRRGNVNEEVLAACLSWRGRRHIDQWVTLPTNPAAATMAADLVPAAVETQQAVSYLPAGEGDAAAEEQHRTARGRRAPGEGDV